MTALDKARDAQVATIVDLICDDILPAYGVSSEAGRNDAELPAAVRSALTALDLSAIGAEGWRTDMTTIPKDGSPLMVWVVDGFTQPHFFAPISITEDGAWWDDSTGDQIEPITGATAWQRAPSPPEPRS